MPSTVQINTTLFFYVHDGATDEALVSNVANAGLPVCAWKDKVTQIFKIRNNGVLAVFQPPGNAFTSLTRLENRCIYWVVVPSANLPFSANGQLEPLQLVSPSPTPPSSTPVSVVLFDIYSINTKLDSNGTAKQIAIVSPPPPVVETNGLFFNGNTLMFNDNLLAFN